MRSASKTQPATRKLGASAASKSKAPGLLAKLHSIELSKKKFKSSDITFIFRNLATLVENGVSLPRALHALSEERSLERCRDLLISIRQSLESGSTFSSAMAKHPEVFDIITVNQVRVGERAGNLVGTLDNIARQREKAGKLREAIIKKLAYPAMLAVVGSGVIVFLLTFVIPVFEETYRSSNIPLPGITQVMIALGSFAKSYGLLVVAAAALGAALIKQLRKQTGFATAMDARILKLPLVGDWLRDIAVLEFMQVISNLMEAGFTLAEALNEAEDSVRNRFVKKGARDLHNAVNRGERFSREIERLGDLFPPVVSQLVIVGEQTGNLAKATGHIRTHLQEEIERRANLFVGVIEPLLTTSMACAVAIILLAIFLPMFDMINTV